MWPELDPHERRDLARVADAALTALGFVFLALLIVEFAFALSPAQSRWIGLAGWLIWAIFTLDFVIRFAVAESKPAYLRSRWLSGVAVVLPAFRVFHALRAVRAVRAINVGRLVTGANRGMRALGQVTGLGAASYLILLSLIIWPLAAAGITWLERDQPDSKITTIWAGLWWSATTIIQQGSDRYPVSIEGRVLAIFVMAFSLAVTGYLTALIASFLLSRRRAGVQDETAALRAEIQALRADLRARGVLRSADGPAQTDDAGGAEVPSVGGRSSQ